MRKQQVVLEDHPDRSLLDWHPYRLRRLVEDKPVERDPPGLDRHQTGECAQYRRLARAIRSQKGDDLARRNAKVDVQGEGPLVVREKTHSAAPMTLTQALYEMELVGHDFYLFVDAETKQPSVVYRRHAYDYGVIHLNPDSFGEEEPGGAGGALGG